MTPSVVVVGDLLVDVVAVAEAPLAHASDTPARVRWTGGGAGGNVAAWLAACGTPPALVARVGADVPGRTLVAELQDAGVETHVAVDAARPTGTCVVLVGADGERSMLPDRGACVALAAADVPPALFTPGAHLHLSGYVLLHEASRAAGLRALGLARRARMTVSVDPASAAPLAASGAGAFLDPVAGVDVLLPNAEEAAVLTGDEDPERAARALAAGARAREVVVTLGADGALWCDGRTVLRHDAETAAVVDSTGAGDAFAAGWLSARLAGATPPEALAAACARGAEAVGRAGARPSGPAGVTAR